MHMSDVHQEYVNELKSGVAAVPLRCDRLVFDHPWHSRAFGLVIGLVKKNAYEFEDFRQSLISTIGNWEGSHQVDDPTWEYYEQWLSAFERLVVSRGLVTTSEIDKRMEEFQNKTREELI
jgi:nitrile hydratase accessory protein